MALVKIDTLHCYRRTNLVLTLRNCWQIYTWMGVEHFCSPESKGNVISQHSAKDPNVNQYLSWVRHKQQEFKPSCTASSWSGTLLVDSGDRYQTITLNQGYDQGPSIHWTLWWRRRLRTRARTSRRSCRALPGSGRTTQSSLGARGY